MSGVRTDDVRTSRSERDRLASDKQRCPQWLLHYRGDHAASRAVRLRCLLRTPSIATIRRACPISSLLRWFADVIRQLGNARHRSAFFPRFALEIFLLPPL